MKNNVLIPDNRQLWAFSSCLSVAIAVEGVIICVQYFWRRTFFVLKSTPEPPFSAQMSTLLLIIHSETLLTISQTCMVRHYNRCFYMVAAILWNNLPVNTSKCKMMLDVFVLSSREFSIMTSFLYFPCSVPKRAFTYSCENHYEGFCYWLWLSFVCFYDAGQENKDKRFKFSLVKQI